MLKNLKILLNISPEDTSLDDKLTLILNMTRSRLKLLLGGIDPPESMDHILTDVSIIRFNRIGSEGMGSHTVEGESMSFSDDDFAGYMEEINAYLESQKENSRGRLRFL